MKTDMLEHCSDGTAAPRATLVPHVRDGGHLIYGGGFD